MAGFRVNSRCVFSVFAALGTYGSAVSEDGSKLYVTWNGNRGGPDRRGRLSFDTCALTVIHIPESERRP